MQRKIKTWLKFLCLGIAVYIGTTAIIFSIKFYINYQTCGHILVQPSDDDCPQDAPSSGQ